MFRKANEMELELREKMRGGNGTVRIRHIFKPDVLKGQARMLAEITIPVGGSIGFHKHEFEEEIFYFIAGQGKVDDQGTIREVKAGDAVLTGGGNGHAVENTGNQPLVFLAVILLY